MPHTPHLTIAPSTYPKAIFSFGSYSVKYHVQPPKALNNLAKTILSWMATPSCEYKGYFAPFFSTNFSIIINMILRNKIRDD